LNDQVKGDVIFVLEGEEAQRGERNAYRILVGKPERKRQLRRLRCVWVDNIKILYRPD
jgi:hypothetical protein